MIYLLALLLLIAPATAQAVVNEVFARNDYVGNSSNVTFPYTFKINTKQDVAVYVGGVLKSVDTHYSVTNVGASGGGAIVMGTAPGTGVKVAIIRAQHVQQSSVYQPNEPFPARRIELDLDKSVMIEQKLVEVLNRSIHVPPPYYPFVSTIDPTGKALQFLVVCPGEDCITFTSVPPNGPGVTLPGGSNTYVQYNKNGVFGGDAELTWNTTAKLLTAGAPVSGTQSAGPLAVVVNNSDNVNGYQSILVQMINGTVVAPLVTLGSDKVAVSGWSFRDSGGSSPIYGANFGVVFANGPQPANGVEIDVQNNDADHGPANGNGGQGLWVNGSGTFNRFAAVRVDTQDSTKWWNGILFGTATGSTATIKDASAGGAGIFFRKSQSNGFIVMQPIDDADGIAIKLTDSAFLVDRVQILKSGAIRGWSLGTASAFPTFGFTDYAGLGMFAPAANALAFSTNGVERVRVGATGVVLVNDLKTTGAASGKKVVCVDTASGQLYASSSGSTCAN